MKVIVHCSWGTKDLEVPTDLTLDLYNAGRLDFDITNDNFSLRRQGTNLLLPEELVPFL